MVSGIGAGKNVLADTLATLGKVAVSAASVAVDALVQAGLAIKDFAVDLFKGAIEAVKGLDELNATIENLGDAAPITAERALELADQFKNLAGGSDDAVLAAEKVLLRFDQIGGDAFRAVPEQSADLAAVFRAATRQRP